MDLARFIAIESLYASILEDSGSIPESHTFSFSGGVRAWLVVSNPLSDG